MNDNTRHAFASYGLEILKRTVLDVLYQAWQYKIIPNRQYLGYNAIHKALDIQRISRKYDRWLIHSILKHLKKDGHAKHVKKNAWQITPEGVKVIEE